MQEIIKALIKAKAEFNPIQKDGTNPHYKRKYATLDAVLDAVTPALGKYGLVVIQTTEIFEVKRHCKFIFIMSLESASPALILYLKLATFKSLVQP